MTTKPIDCTKCAHTRRCPIPRRHREHGVDHCDLYEPQRTAAEEYARTSSDCGILLDLIAQELKAHSERAAKEPKQWGYVGNVEHVRASLKQILVGLAPVLHASDEEEASCVIEQHLADARE